MSIQFLRHIVALIFVATSVQAEEFRAVFWNLESGDSDNRYIARQMVEKVDVDFWGLSEVHNQSAVDTFEAALERAHGADYVAKLSREGGGDRLAILYRADKLEAVRYTGRARVDQLGGHFFEVDEINVGGTIRPGLGVQLRTRDTGRGFIALVNHWKCCGGDDDRVRRAEQAVAMNAFATASVHAEIVSGGDFNIPFNRGGANGDAFRRLAGVWEYVRPVNVVGSHTSGTLLDGVFMANRTPGMRVSLTVLERAGHSLAATTSFDDDAKETDHRPLLLVVESAAENRKEEIERRIAETRATLERLEAELERLKRSN